MLGMGKSELAYFITLTIFVGLGFAKAFISSFPFEQEIGAIGGLTVIFFTKRRVQQWMDLKFNNKSGEDNNANTK